jgi:SAM-dependent methyltransferase
MYDLVEYVGMISDPVRVGAYRRALAAVVRPGDVVLEIGTGPGLFAVEAARLGARHVYAIEPHQIVSLGPALAATAGVADRITFIRADSRGVSLPERATVLLEDLRGAMPFYAQRRAVLADAHARLMAPDARIVSVRDRIYVQPAAAPQAWAARNAARAEATAGLGLAPLERKYRENWTRDVPSADELRLAPALVGDIDLRHWPVDGLDATVRWRAGAPMEIAGYAAWFDAELAGGEVVSNAPGAPRHPWGSLWFPLLEPVALVPGDEIELRFRQVPQDGDYMPAWETTVTAGGVRRAVARQSAFGGSLPDPDALAAATPDHVPAMDGDLGALQRLLARVNGAASNAAIAARLRADAPERFPTDDAALAWVTRALGALRRIGQ